MKQLVFALVMAMRSKTICKLTQKELKPDRFTLRNLGCTAYIYVMSPVKRLAPCWVCGGLISIRAMQCPHCGEPEPGPYSFEKAERDHAEEMARLEENKQRQEQWLRDNRLILCLAGVLFAIPLSFILVDLFDVWWIFGEK